MNENKRIEVCFAYIPEYYYGYADLTVTITRRPSQELDADRLGEVILAAWRRYEETGEGL